MKRHILMIALALFLAVAAVSCNDGGPHADVLRIALDIEDRDRYDELFAEFTRETGIEIYATYGEDIGKLVGTRDEPDLIKTSTVAVLAMKDSLLDLSDLVEADDDVDTDRYLDEIMSALTIDGSIYALPTSINTSLLYYNKDLFDASEDAIRNALGLGPDESVYPETDWTYEDYRKAGVALTKYTGDGDDRTYNQFGAATQLDWWGEWLVYLRQMGGTFYEPGTDSHVSALDSDEALEATQFFVDKSMGGDDEKFAPDALQASSGFSFMNGNVAMVFGGHIGNWYSYDALDLNWDIQMLPTPVGMPDARGGEISADAFGISVRSDKVEDAFRFLKMWTGEDGALKMYEFNKIGALKNMESLIADLPEDKQKDIQISQLFDAIELALTLPEEKDFQKVMREIVMAELYKLMFDGRGSVDDVEGQLESIKEQVDTYYENLYG